MPYTTARIEMVHADLDSVDSRLVTGGKAVFRWVMQRYHFSDFEDVDALVHLKGQQRIAVCIPTRNEADTIGEIVSVVKRELCDRYGLIDEVWVIDSDSEDQTRAIALQAGATVRRSAEIAPELGTHMGKGENLWKALHATTCDLICYIDGDISNFHAGFITGLLGPLLKFSELEYVKAYYERPLSRGDELHSTGGGRVSEILVRPMISMFYPELVPILQPLSGEYAARRRLLESLAFPTGYGVEIAHLIDMAQRGMLEQVAQTDLVRRVHRNREDGDLGDTAYAILKVMLRRMTRDGKIKLTGSLTDVHHRWLVEEQGIVAIQQEIPEPERPPFMSVANFQPL